MADHRRRRLILKDDSRKSPQYFDRPPKVAKVSCNLNSSMHTLINELGVRFAPAPFGPEMRGNSSSDAFLNILSMAHVSSPDRKTLDTYENLFSVLNELNVDVYKAKGSRHVNCSSVLSLARTIPEIEHELEERQCHHCGRGCATADIGRSHGDVAERCHCSFSPRAKSNDTSSDAQACPTVLTVNQFSTNTVMTVPASGSARRHATTSVGQQPVTNDGNDNVKRFEESPKQQSPAKSKLVDESASSTTGVSTAQLTGNLSAASISSRIAEVERLSTTPTSALGQAQISARPTNKERMATLETAEIEEIYRDLDKCFDVLNDQERLLENSHADLAPKHVRTLARSYERLLKFMTSLRLTLHRWLTFDQLDQETFQQLFLDFAWIFRIPFRLVTSSLPLIVKGEEISTTPDLIFEDLSGPLSSTGRILSVAVAEVKGTAIPQISPSHSQSHDHNPHLCEIHDQSIEDDSAILPENLCRQHAYQLVHALPFTRSRNKECMLGFILQATKVHLTCLVMTTAHRNHLHLPDFDPSAYEDATVYYTKGYDMLNRGERKHLIHILLAVSSLNKYNKVDFCIDG